MKTPTLKRGMGLKNSVTAESDFKSNLQLPLERTKFKVCTCDRDNDHCQLVSYQNGIDDAEDLRADFTIDHLIKRYRNRCRYGYCTKCAWQYIQGLLIKLEYLKGKNLNGMRRSRSE